jgi:hypothetical protein
LNRRRFAAEYAVFTMRTAFLAIILCSTLGFGGCKRQATSSGPEQATGKLAEACSLLTAQEIQDIQGAPVKDSKSSERADGRFHISQCYFAADPSHRSVSLTVTQLGAGNSDRTAVKDLWRQNFTHRAEEGKETEAEREKRKSLSEQKQRGEEEEGPPLKKIDGTGDEAYWAGSRVGGALYVLKGDAYIRISLGGPDTEEAKIEKSKKLAQKAIARL